MPDHDQARADNMHPTGKSKPRPVSALVIIGILVAIIAVLVLK